MHTTVNKEANGGQPISPLDYTATDSTMIKTMMTRTGGKVSSVSGARDPSEDFSLR